MQLMFFGILTATCLGMVIMAFMHFVTILEADDDFAEDEDPAEDNINKDA